MQNNAKFIFSGKREKLVVNYTFSRRISGVSTCCFPHTVGLFSAYTHTRAHTLNYWGNELLVTRLCSCTCMIHFNFMQSVKIFLHLQLCPVFVWKRVEVTFPISQRVSVCAHTQKRRLKTKRITHVIETYTVVYYMPNRFVLHKPFRVKHLN